MTTKRRRKKPAMAQRSLPLAPTDEEIRSAFPEMGEIRFTTRPGNGGAVVYDLDEPLELRQTCEIELSPELEGEDIRAKDLDELPDEIEMSFSSETPVFRWGDKEILSHEKGDADFSRLRTVGAILKNHNPNIIVGVPTKVWLDEKQRKGRLRMRFGSTPEARQAKREVLIDRTLRGDSVGYTVKQFVYLKDRDVVYKDRIRGPAYVATKWQALEASLTPVAADPSVGVGRALGLHARQNQKKGDTMEPKFREWLAARGQNPDDLSQTDTARLRAEYEAELKGGAQQALPLDTPQPPATPKREAPTTPAAPTVDVDAVREEARANERKRAAEITKLCSTHGVDDAARERMLADGIDVDTARGRVLNIIAERNAAVGVKPTVDTLHKVDGRESFVRSMIEGMRLRVGHIQRKDLQYGGAEFANRPLMELARECLKRAGMRVPTSTLEIAAKALAGPRISPEDIASYTRGDPITGTTSDFPYILAAGVNKTMLDAFGQVSTSYERWCKIGSVNDFKVVYRTTLSEFSDLELIPEAGTYRGGAMAEDRNGIQVFTHGRKYNVSRQAIINDDMDAFRTIPVKMGRAAARLPNILAVQKLLENPTLTDGAAVFSDTHNNNSADANLALDTDAHAIAGIRNIKKLLQEQRGRRHAQAVDDAQATLYMSFMLNVLLVATEEQAWFARRVLGVNLPADTNSGVPNPLQADAPTVVQEILLSDTVCSASASSTGYYGVTNPADAPVIEVAFLDGQREPYMEETDQIDADGRVFKIREDCGAAAIDYLGMAREAGA